MPAGIRVAAFLSVSRLIFIINFLLWDVVIVVPPTANLPVVKAMAGVALVDVTG